MPRPLPVAPPNTLPGILPDHIIRSMVERGSILTVKPLHDAQIQPASMDLRLGTHAYCMPYSILPNQTRWIEQHPTNDSFDTLSLTDGAVLEKGQIYLIPLLESLALPSMVEARANPKSSTGRADVFCRLLASGASRFDLVPKGYYGPLYLEVFPRSFSIRVQTGLALTQLRFSIGHSQWNDIATSTIHAAHPLAYDPQTGLPLELSFLKTDGLVCRVNLRQANSVIGYRAKPDAPVLDLLAKGTLDPRLYWDPISPSAQGSLVLQPEEFYLLSSYERISIPTFAAADVAAYDLSLGELRTHYAGFFDPGFGVHDGPVPGTPAVLEVRAHDVPCLLEHQQPLFTVSYASLQSRPTRSYGASIGSTYHQQNLTLSKHFAPWPNI